MKTIFALNKKRKLPRNKNKNENEILKNSKI